MGFDAGRQRVVLFGGELSTNHRSGETWEWDGAAWTQVGPSEPPPRYGHTLEYDPVRGETVLFGGAGVPGDTWAWDGQSWQRRASEGPGARGWARTTFDSTRQRLVLFGGLSPSNSPLGDTWEWDGAQWEQRGVEGPGPRFSHSIAYDGARGVTVLFGGRSSLSGPYLGDTWEWDGAAWTLAATEGPSARADAGMAYDPIRQCVVLRDGHGTGAGFAETWEWDGAAWSRVWSSFETARADPTLVWDHARGVTLLISASERMEWSDGQWAKRSPSWTSRWGPFAYDSARQRLIAFGGLTYRDGQEVIAGDTLELASNPGPPIVISHPGPVTVRVGGSVTFTAQVGGQGPYTYQWRRTANSNIADGLGGAGPGGGLVSGATTPVLSISGVQPSDGWQSFSCTVSNACGPISTAFARLTVLPACASADFDGDGAQGTDADIEAFFACLAGACCPTCWVLGADFDADGDVGTDPDIEAFFRVLAGGSC